MRTFRLPDLGEGLSEAEIVNWHVSAGDRVVADQPLVSVETDKAVVEVPSPYTGTVVALHAKPGDIIPIGNPIADFDDAGVHEDKGTVVGSVPQQETAPVAEISHETPAHANVRAMPAVRALARKMNVDLVAVDGTGPGGAITADDVERLPARCPMPARRNRCTACAAPWRRRWSSRMPRSCLRPSMTKPMWNTA